jgi:hypothetical protein
MELQPLSDRDLIDLIVPTDVVSIEGRLTVVQRSPDVVAEILDRMDYKRKYLELRASLAQQKYIEPPKEQYERE